MKKTQKVSIRDENEEGRAYGTERYLVMQGQRIQEKQEWQI